MEEQKMTIDQIVEEVKEEMCDKYCKYPEEYEGSEMIDVICVDCPLNRL